MSDFKPFYTEFISKLAEAKSKNNPKEFQNLLYVVEPQWEAADQSYYVEYCQTKAGIFALFGENLDLDDWMQKALQFSEEKQRVEIYFKWINLYWNLAKAVNDQAKLQAIFSSLFNVSSQAEKLDMGKYDVFAFQSVRAFALAALGKHAELSEYFSSLKWEAIPTKLINNPLKLKYFYSQIYKMLIAALEIRSEKYLTSILQMITIDDALMVSNAPLFRKFNTVVMDIADIRGELATDFNSFYQLRKKWAGFLPNFSLFTMMIEEENQKGLDLFFKGME
jgi:hypothetical protein